MKKEEEVEDVCEKKESEERINLKQKMRNCHQSPKKRRVAVSNINITDK